MDLYDGCAGGVGVQVELQKFEKNFYVEHWQGETQIAAELCWPSGKLLSFAPRQRRCGVVIRQEVKIPILSRQNAARQGWGTLGISIIYGLITFAGDSCVFELIVYSGEIGEFECEAKFLRGQRAGGQAGTELL